MGSLSDELAFLFVLRVPRVFQLQLHSWEFHMKSTLYHYFLNLTLGRQEQSGDI